MRVVLTELRYALTLTPWERRLIYLSSSLVISYPCVVLYTRPYEPPASSMSSDNNSLTLTCRCNVCGTGNSGTCTSKHLVSFTLKQIPPLAK